MAEVAAERRSKTKDAVVRWALYVVKAALLAGALYALGRYAGMLPPAAIAATWAVLSVASMLGMAYHHVMRKTLRQYAYEAGGRLAKLNNGRAVCLVVSFLISAVFVASLMLEVPKWGAVEWGIAGAGALAYPFAFLLARWILRGEYRPMFRTSKAAWWSAAAVGVALCAAYLAACLAQPAGTFGSAAEAFDSVARPFESSPSALMREADLLTAFGDGLVAYGISKVAETSGVLYVALKVALGASAFFGVASLLGLCALGWSELRRVFLPLEAGEGGALPELPAGAGAGASGRAGVRKDAVVLSAALPVLLATSFLVADALVARAEEGEEYTPAERFVRDQVGVAVFMLDGKPYDYMAAEGLLAQAQAASDALYEQAVAELVPLVNASFDARLANVDGYLDWYYSLPADYERLVTMITGTVEDYMQEQFTSNIENGIDDSALEGALQDYADQAARLEQDTIAQLAELEVTGVPEWLLTERVPLADDVVSKTLEPSGRILSAGERLGLSAGAGAVAGTVTKHVAERLATRVVEKEFFKQFVNKVAGIVGKRAIGSVAGGAIGTLAGPLGTAVGVVAGTAVGVGLDYGTLKIDEWQNRDSYREEIVQTIEDERSEVLAAVQGEQTQ